MFQTIREITGEKRPYRGKIIKDRNGNTMENYTHVEEQDGREITREKRPYRREMIKDRNGNTD